MFTSGRASLHCTPTGEGAVNPGAGVLAQPQEHLAQPRLLCDHSRDADEVMLAQSLPVDVLDVLVQEIYVVVASKRRHRG